MAYITPEEALQRGFWMVKAPSLGVLLGSLGIYILLSQLRLIPSMGYPGLVWAAPFFLVSFVGGWLVWSVQVPRWRLWAYRRVEDIELLEAIAVERQLVWPQGSVFEKTELLTKAVREELKALLEQSRSRFAGRQNAEIRFDMDDQDAPPS